jgi:hypothetical protein
VTMWMTTELDASTTYQHGWVQQRVQDGCNSVSKTGAAACTRRTASPPRMQLGRLSWASPAPPHPHLESAACVRTPQALP